jgi:type IV pilus assembly protein PilV
MMKVLREQGGFTLVEVLIAISILTVGLLAVGTMQISAIRGNGLSDNTTIALTLAEDKMEDLLGKSYTNGDLTNGNHVEGNIDESGQPGGFFRRTWNVTDNVPPTAPTDFKEITMTVSWADNKHHVSLASIKRP